MRALDDSGAAVPWWFAYKLPSSLYGYSEKEGPFDPFKHPRKKHPLGDDGHRYLFFKAGDEELALSACELDADRGKPGAITHTLAQLFGPSVPETVGYIAYNDEFPKPGDLVDPHAACCEGKNNGGYGHNKGVLAFDVADGSAIWLIHSFPRWPAPGQTFFPNHEGCSRLKFGQSFLCISLKDLKTVDLIAWMMRRFHEPQIIHAKLPKPGAQPEVGGVLAELYELAKENAPGQPPPASRGNRFDTAELAGELTFQAWSPQGVPPTTTTFHLFAKGRDWGEDFWIDLVSHRLGIDLLTETWRRDSRDQRKPTALHTPSGSDGEGDVVEDAFVVRFAALNCYFNEYADHAKWAVGKDGCCPQVCVGDINRQSSQTKRGGGAVVFTDNKLADELRKSLWLTDRERAGKAKIKLDGAGHEIAGSDEEERQKQDRERDKQREAQGKPGPV